MSRPVVGMRCFTSHERREMRRQLIAKYGAVCQICKARGENRAACVINLALDTLHPKAFSIDHIVALADGGSNTIDNMWPSHRRCNTLKGSKTGGSVRKYRRNDKGIESARLAYTSSSR